MSIKRYSTIVVVLLLAACANAPNKTAPAPAPAKTAPGSSAAPASAASTSTSTSAAPAAPAPTPAVPSPPAPPPPAPPPPAPVAPPAAAVAPAPVSVAAKPVTAPVPTAAPVAKKPVAAVVTAAPASPTPAIKAAPVAAAETAKPEAAGAAGNTLSGQLSLVAAPGQNVDPADVANAVVYFVPAAHVAAPKPGLFRIYTSNKTFDPESIVVPLGSTISFPNKDEILHNVFSVTPGSEFDLGLYGEGASADHKFGKAGVVVINCNAHHVMQANVLVLDTPYYTHPGKDGRFELNNLPAGGGKLMYWHSRGTVQGQAVSIPAAEPSALTLSITKPRITQHVNKEGKAY